MTTTERERLIEEVRDMLARIDCRRASGESLGVGPGWTEGHMRAMLEEIYDLRARVGDDE